MVRILRGSLEGNCEHPHLRKVRLVDEGVPDGSMLTLEGSAREDASILTINNPDIFQTKVLKPTLSVPYSSEDLLSFHIPFSWCSGAERRSFDEKGGIMIPVMIPSSAIYLCFLRTPPPSVGCGEVKVALRQFLNQCFI